MKFLADENTDGIMVALLRQKGFTVLDIKELSPGIDDIEVLKMANQENAILITEDKDFGELVYRLKMVNHGVMLIRLSGWESSQKGKYVAEVIDRHKEQFWDSFSVISTDKIRIRKMMK
ncbi:MAG: DUF5615 family PIN-like protein [Bacteroidia bacterium]